MEGLKPSSHISAYAQSKLGDVGVSYLSSLLFEYQEFVNGTDKIALYEMLSAEIRQMECWRTCLCEFLSFGEQLIHLFGKVLVSLQDLAARHLGGCESRRLERESFVQFQEKAPGQRLWTEDFSRIQASVKW